MTGSAMLEEVCSVDITCYKCAYASIAISVQGDKRNKLYRSLSISITKSILGV